MDSEASIDLIPLERLLHGLAASLRESDTEDSWNTVEKTSKELADNLRIRNAPVDNHTILGKTELPQTLTSLLSLGLPTSHIPADSRTSPILEILRVGANFCMDHNDNRAALLEVGFPQAVMSILEGYAETIPSPPNGKPLPLSIPHLKIVRTSIGVLLNASIGFDLVKFRLTSLEAALTIIKLSATIYLPTSWISAQTGPSYEKFEEEWNIRSGISNWAWRTVSALKDGQDETLQMINSEVLPWITAPLLQFCPPQSAATSLLGDSDPDMLDNLVQTDFDFLEESCTLIESLSLDVEDFRLELARASCYPKDGSPVSCLTTILNFVEYGTYPALWKSPVFDEADRKKKEKAFDICKAALIKAVVEVFGEEKNEDVLWVDTDPQHPGGPLVNRLVGWITGYVEAKEVGKERGTDRADLTICASLSLGNLIRKVHVAVALLSSPYSLAPVLSSSHFISPSTDINLKHGILGLLKHLSQFSKLSPIIPASLYEVNIIQRIASSGIWDNKSDAMADVIQLNAIGVAKHMCHASLDHTFALVLPSDDRLTGLSQILALIKRSDSVSIKSEGSRVLVNVVRTVWFSERSPDPSGDKQKKREQCISLLLTAEVAQVLTGLIGRSNKYPLLVNEGIVALSLLSTHRSGGPLVIDALTIPLNPGLPSVSPPSSASTTSNESSLSLPTASSMTLTNDGLPLPRHALDMLIFVIRNVDNPVNFPIEVRMNACTFFLQLQRHAPPASLAKIREAVVPVVQQVIEDAEDDNSEEKLVKAAKLLLENWPRPQPSV